MSNPIYIGDVVTIFLEATDLTLAELPSADRIDIHLWSPSATAGLGVVCSATIGEHPDTGRPGVFYKTSTSDLDESGVWTAQPRSYFGVAGSEPKWGEAVEFPVQNPG